MCANSKQELMRIINQIDMEARNRENQIDSHQNNVQRKDQNHITTRKGRSGNGHMEKLKS